MLCTSCLALSQDVTVTGRVFISKAGTRSEVQDQSNAVVWLTPLENPLAPLNDSAAPRPQLAQKGKSFSPHLLVVPVGTVVDFPNRDPIFHNVFSLFEGKRFDLGLYESGSSRAVHFNRPGISYIFCNIHPEMTAIVVVTATRYFGVSDSRGQVSIPKVPAGRYALRVWYERSSPEELSHQTKDITVSAEFHSIGNVRLVESAILDPSHKNKYGEDYETPTPSSPIYDER